MEAESKTDHATQRHKKRSFFTQQSLGLLALVIATATGVVNFFQYRSANKAIQVAHLDSDRTIKLSNRPYVGVTATQVADKYQGTPLYVKLTAIGASPALDTVLQMRCFVLDAVDLGENVSPPESEWKAIHARPGHADISPGNSVDYPCRAAKTDNIEVPDVFVIGKVAYKDVFGSSHETDFCLVRGPIGPGPMYACTTGNLMN